MAVDGVLVALPPETQEEFAHLAECQRDLAPRAIAALEAGEVSSGVEPDIRGRAIQILGSFASRQFTATGYEDVPLSIPLGAGSLGENIQAFTSLRLPVEGSPNYFGQRPLYPENRANQVALFALHGLGLEDIITANTAGTGNHVAVVLYGREGELGLARDGNGRVLPADGQGEKLIADAVILANPNVRKAIAGVHGDLPIIMGTAGDSLIFMNAGWQNLAAGVDITTSRRLSMLGLGDKPIRLAVGPGARDGFEIGLQKLKAACAGRIKLGARSNLDGLLDPRDDNPEKADLNLLAWAGRLASILSRKGGRGGSVAITDLCVLAGGRAGYLHSSRIHRMAPTVPGQSADGDRNIAFVMHTDVQREWARLP